MKNTYCQNYPEIFDTIIIGAGPAGMTAAIYAARRKMKILLICGNVGGQMLWCSDIENYTGVEQSTGPKLSQRFFEHVKKVDQDNAHFDLWVRENEKVTTINGSFTENFVVTTDSQKTFTSKTIIITTGKKPRTLGVPGEKIAAQGNGLSFAATSDAPLYKDKKMAVIGGGNSAMDVALQLEKFTDDITIFVYDKKLIGEGIMMDKIKQSDKIKVEYEVDTKEILLDPQNKVSGIQYQQNNTLKTFPCQGVFEEIGQVPATKFVRTFLDLNEKQEIPTNRRCCTNTKGVFAAGDCTNQPHKQVIVATGEGAIAALEAHELLLRST